MSTFHVYNSTDQLVATAAQETISTLHKILEQNDTALWILAGGTSPLAAYRYIAEHYADVLDWSKVTLIIGDERMVAADHPDSNWRQIRETLLANNAINQSQQIIPNTTLPTAIAAQMYDDTVREQFHKIGPKATVAWLGMGEDGHTLSLFPEYPDNQPSESFVIPVYNSPKPPSERISLTAHALTGVRTTYIFASGEAKRNALHQVRANGDLPVATVAHHIERTGGTVHWLADKAAYSATDEKH